MTDASSDTLLVTGAGGHLGRKVIEELLQRGAQHVIGTTRDPAKLGDLAERGVEIREADFDRPETLTTAFKGVDRVLLVSTDALYPPGLRLRQHRAAVAAATESSVRHVIYTSLPNPHPTAEGSIPDDHFWTEVALFDSRLDWTILRNNLYAEGLLWFAGQAIKNGQLVTATGTAGRSYVARDDAARTAAGALLAGTGRAVYDVTGPVALTQDELVAELNAITGRSIKHTAMPAEEAEQSLLATGMPPGMARALRHFDVDAAEGYHAVVTPTVERFSGRTPLAPLDFLRARRAEITEPA